jgi:DeoR/GlpR family transcriptional regulator of sugar metabolism
MRFLSNHAHVLYCLAQDPAMRLREVADRVGITERAAHRIVGDLEQEGYIKRHRNGARNTYELHLDVPLSDDLEGHVQAGELLAVLLRDQGGAARSGDLKVETSA